MLTVLLIFIFLTCGILAWRKRLNSNAPPVFSGALPLLGHAQLLLGDRAEFWIYLKEISSECTQVGGVVSAHIGPQTYYFITDPEDCLTVANTCLQKNYTYKFLKPWIGNGLLTADVPTWKSHRKLLDPAFRPSILNGFMDVFNDQARRMVTELETEVGKGPFDQLVYTKKNTLEAAFSTIFGVKFADDVGRSNQYMQAAEALQKVSADRTQNFLLHCDFMFRWSTLKKQQDKNLETLHGISNDIISKRKEEYLKNKKKDKNIAGRKYKSFLDFLLELAIDQGALNDQEIKDHVDTLLFASHNTTASVLMYTMLLIGSHPKVQKKIFEELTKVYGDDNRDVTSQDLTRLVYLKAVIQESVRYYPTSPILVRHLDKDVKLKNCTLSNGGTCALLIHGVHRHPVWGSDAEEFKPERWLNPDTLPESTAAYAGFSLGERTCIGQSYAYMSMLATLVHVCKHYEISGYHTDMVLKLDDLLKPISGHHIAIKRRNLV